MHGDGVYKWPDGRVFKGFYQHDKKHGKGIFTWKDGRKYKGLWYEGNQDGKGIFRTVKGEIYDMEYDKGSVVSKKKRTGRNEDEFDE